jgi:hypothetical protein
VVVVEFVGLGVGGVAGTTLVLPGQTVEASTGQAMRGHMHSPDLGRQDMARRFGSQQQHASPPSLLGVGIGGWNDGNAAACVEAVGGVDSADDGVAEDDDDDVLAVTVTVRASAGQMTSAQMHSPAGIEGSQEMADLAMSQQQQVFEPAASSTTAAAANTLMTVTRAASQVLAGVLIFVRFDCRVK